MDDYGYKESLYFVNNLSVWSRTAQRYRLRIVGCALDDYGYKESLYFVNNLSVVWGQGQCGCDYGYKGDYGLP